ncbi:aldo/keto reductase [Subtercola sp. YIM 133946]|uniref:aldo/keto reductase n=1 Tax=Subtercola sp. YIM 133946 TaxID=3118909 RepID=UPI002F924AFF
MSTSTLTPGGSAPLGRHTVARVGYGAMQLEKFRDDRASAITLLHHALDLGVNHFDTADFYGHGFVNDLLREAVVDRPDVVIVTKVGALPDAGPIPLRPAQKPHELRASVEGNLSSLGVDRLDVVNLRRVGVGPGIRAQGDQVVDLDDQLAELIALRDEGKLGEIGLSSVTAETLLAALPAGIVCVQNVYSLVDRSFEGVLEACVANGVAWVPFFPLGGGRGGPMVREVPAVVEAAAQLGATPSQVGLAWLLQHSPNSLLIPGTSTPDHLDENVAAGSLVVPAEVMRQLDSLALDQDAQIV